VKKINQRKTLKIQIFMGFSLVYVKKSMFIASIFNEKKI